MNVHFDLFLAAPFPPHVGRPWVSRVLSFSGVQGRVQPGHLAVLRGCHWISLWLWVQEVALPLRTALGCLELLRA